MRVTGLSLDTDQPFGQFSAAPDTDCSTSAMLFCVDEGERLAVGTARPGVWLVCTQYRTSHPRIEARGATNETILTMGIYVQLEGAPCNPVAASCCGCGGFMYFIVPFCAVFGSGYV